MASTMDEKASPESSADTPVSAVSPEIAVFPKYVTREPTTITINEGEFPNARNWFDVLLPDGQPLFYITTAPWDGIKIARRIFDAKNNAPILLLKRVWLKLQFTWKFEDEDGNTVLDWHLNDWIPTPLGNRAKASFTNSADQSPVELITRGNWHARHATIENSATGEVIASVRSEYFTWKAYRGRRDYEVSVSAGVDLAIITCLVLCLDIGSSG